MRITLLVLVFLAFCHATAGEEPTADKGEQQDQNQAIDEQIQRLSDDSYLVREQAEKTLWAFGEEAKPALQAAVQGGDLEKRERAARILAEFEFGIMPELAPKRLELLRNFRQSDTPQRLAILFHLLQQSDFETTTDLLDRLKNPNQPANQRGLLFRESLNNLELMLRLIEAKRLVWWIDTAGDGQALGMTRSDLLSRLFGDSDRIKKLADEDRLAVIADAIEQLLQPAEVATFLTLLFRTNTVKEIYSQAAKVDDLLRLIELSSEPLSRQVVLLAFLQNNREHSLALDPSFGKLLRFANNKCLPSTSTQVCDQLIQNLLLGSESLAELGVADLRKVADQLDEAQFSKLLSQLKSNYYAQKWILNPAYFRELVGWASTATPTKRRPEIVDLLIETLTTRSLTSVPLEDPVALDLLWTTIEQISAPDWQQLTHFRLAPLLARQSLRQTPQAKQVLASVLSVTSPESDIALIGMLGQSAFIESLYADDKARNVIERVAKCDTQADDSIIERSLSLVLNVNSVQEYFVQKENSEWLLGEFLESKSVEDQARLLLSICSSNRLLQAWRDQPWSDRLIDRVDEMPDLEKKAALMGRLLRQGSMVARLVELEREQPLRMFADPTLAPDVRAGLLPDLASSLSYVRWLTDNDLMEAFLAEANTLSDPQRKASVLKGLSQQPNYAEFLISQGKVEVWFASVAPDPQNPRELARFFGQYPDTVLSIISHSQLESLLTFSDKITEPRQRADFLSRTVYSSQSVALHLKHGWIERLFKIAAEETVPIVQSSMLAGLGTQQTIRGIVDAEMVDVYIDLSHSVDVKNGYTMGRIFADPYLLNHLHKNGRSEVLIEVAGALGQHGPMLLTSTPVIDTLINEGYLGQIVAMIKAHDGQEKALSNLLINRATIRWYSEHDEMAELVTEVEAMQDPEQRARTIAGLFRSETASAYLLNHLSLKKLLETMDKMTSSHERPRARVAVFLAAARRETLDANSLGEMMDVFEQNSKSMRYEMSQLFSEPITTQLVKHGYFDPLDELVQQVARFDESKNQPLTDWFFSTASILSELEKRGQWDRFVEFSEGLRDARRIGHFTKLFSSRNDALRYLVEHEHFALWTDLVDRMSGPDKESLLNEMIWQTRIADFISSEDSKGKLFDYLASQPDAERLVQSVVARILQGPLKVVACRNPGFIDSLLKHYEQNGSSNYNFVVSQIVGDAEAACAMVETGQFEKFLRISELDPDQQQSRLNRHLNSPGGMTQALLIRGEIAKVIELRKRVDSPEQSVLSEIAIYRAVGSLSEQIKLREAADGELSPQQHSWLAYAYRALGDYSVATAHAAKSNDRVLRLALASEQDDWASAAELLAEAACPIAGISSDDPDSVESQVEYQAMRMLSRYYAGQDDQLRGPMDQILTLLSESENEKLRWACCTALLLSEQYEPAFQRIKEHSAEHAFGLHAFRRQYAEAIKAMGWNETENQALLANLEPSQVRANGKFWLLADVMVLLEHVGDRDSFEALHRSVMSFADAYENPRERRMVISQYAGCLYRNRMFDTFWDTVDELESKDAQSNVVTHVFGNDPLKRRLAYGLWSLNRKADRTEKEMEYLERDPLIIQPTTRQIDAIVNGQVVSEQLIDNWLEFAINTKDRDFLTGQRSLAVGMACLAADRREDAMRCFEPLLDSEANDPSIHSSAVEVLAHDAWRRQDWDAAAKWFELLGEIECDRPDAAYLAGEALRRDGDTEAGNAKWKLALCGLYQPESLLRLSKLLIDLSEPELANEVLRQGLFVTLPQRSVYLRTMASLGDTASNSVDRASWFRQLQFCQTRDPWGYDSVRWYLERSILIHDAMAQTAFEKQDWDAVDEQLGACLQASDGNVGFYLTWISRLDEADELVRANNLRTQLLGFWKARADRFPNSEVISNNVKRISNRTQALEIVPTRNEASSEANNEDVKDLPTLP